MSRILVIDDDPGVLRAVYRILKDHDVMALNDPELALERLVSGEYEFNVVLCDISLPRLSGLALYEKATAARPELSSCFVFFTGNGDQAAIAFLGRPDIRVLHKPFETAELLETIKTVASLPKEPDATE